MKNNHGISLMELLVAVALSGIIILAVASGFKMLSTNYNNLNNQVLKQSQMQELVGELQKFMAPGDLRYMAWSGGSAVGDKVLARALIPLPGVCGDLTTTGCAQDTAFLYVNHYRNTAPSAMAICFFDTSHLLIDTNNPTYGRSVWNANTFTSWGDGQVVTGTLKIKNNTLIAVGNSPIMTLWRATGSSTANPIATIPVAPYYNPPLPADCQANLQPGYGVSGLVSVPVAPFIIHQFTGNNTVTATDITSNIGTAPYQVFAPTVRVIGRQPTNPPQVGIFDCTVNNGTVACPSQPLSKTIGVSEMRVQHIYKAAFGAYTSPRYDVINSAMTQSASCASPDCQILPLASTSSIPVLWSNSTHAETFNNLSSAGFSLLKQEALSRLRIRLDFTDNTPEASIDIVFP